MIAHLFLFSCSYGDSQHLVKQIGTCTYFIFYGTDCRWRYLFLFFGLSFITYYLLVLSDGRKLHTVQYEGDLYLPKFDLMVLIPNLERQMASFKMGIENKSISVESHPEIFAEMNEYKISF